MSATAKISALICNQCKDVLKNREVLILFFVYPLVGAVMNSAIPDMFQQANFFIAVFGAMHIVFTPLVAATALIAEEREKHTLKVLMMSNVKPVEYLISVGSFIFLCTMITGMAFIVMGKYSGMDACRVILYMAAGCICSMVLGAVIGMSSKSMTGANATAVPLGLVIAFTPMLSFFNKSVGKVSKYLYGQQISNLMSDPTAVSSEGIIIIAVNFILILAVFIYFARKQRVS